MTPSNAHSGRVSAITTHYKGYAFRSRLEARWAVFFDTARIRWVYEPEGFHLPSGNYLPDFWIGDGTPGATAYQHWLEVKPTRPTPYEVRLFSEVCDRTTCYGFILCGQPGEEEILGFDKEGDSMDDGFEGSLTDGDHLLARLSCGPFALSSFAPRHLHELRYKNAVAAARSARFEHGQSGATRNTKAAK